jgi:hypothetical protein
MRAGEESGWLDSFRKAYPNARLAPAQAISLPYRYGGKDAMSFVVARFVVPAPSHR